MRTIEARLIGVSLGRKNVLQGTGEERIVGGRGWAREGVGGGGMARWDQETAADTDAVAGDNDDRDGPGSRKTTMGRQWRWSGLAGGRGRMRQTTEGSVANGGKGRVRRRHMKPVASTEPAGWRNGRTVGSWRTTMTSRLHPIWRLPGGRVVEEEYNESARSGAPQDLGMDRHTTMSRLHQSHVWSMEAHDRARRSTKRMPATVKPPHLPPPLYR